MGKRNARIDVWLKDLAPSTELWKWYGQDAARWPAFRKRYWAELNERHDLLALLKLLAHEKTATFVYAAGDDERNSAIALAEYLARCGK